MHSCHSVLVCCCVATADEVYVQLQRAFVLAVDAELTKEAYKFKVCKATNHTLSELPSAMLQTPEVCLHCRCQTCSPGQIWFCMPTMLQAAQRKSCYQCCK